MWLAATAAVIGLLLGLALLFASVRRLARREPYRSFLRLKARQKLFFFRRLLSDGRVPMGVKLIPVVTVLYLAMPIDLVPDFIPVLGQMDDVAVVALSLAALMALSPRPVIEELLQLAAREGTG